MNAKNLTNDAKAILLLCGRFGKNDMPRPFSLGEYNRLTDWMLDKKIRPADLMTAGTSTLLETLPRDIDGERVKRLLGRGAAMALTIDKWTGSGIWVICRSDADYPVRLKRHLKKQAPAILYGVGRADLLQLGGLAVVGSRNVDQSGEAFTRLAVAACAKQGISIVSGGARGVDQVAMLEGLHAGGTAIGALADSLLKSAVAKKYRDGIREQRLVLVSAFSPEARFNVGNAMGRNKHIYALADFGLIISAEKGKGGTWAGATEELKRDTPRPVFVRQGPDVPEGNRALMDLGALPFPDPPWGKDLAERLTSKPAAKRQSLGAQRTLFGEPAKAPSAATGIGEELKNYPHPTPVEKIDDATANTGSQKDWDLTVFKAVLPVLLNALKDWKGPKDLSDDLNVRKAQLDDWLKRALEEGQVQKKTRPVRYRRAG
ncbi:MAG: DNA-protecting protein DprA [Desulfobacterales bacterium]|nr:DNA-protecting protein DprA [Desulfobacterales bacterium]